MMTKIYRVTPLATLMALLLAAGCTKERPTLEEPADPSASAVTPSYGSTYMSLSLRTGGGSGDTAEDGSGNNYISDWAGTDDITSFAVYIVSEDRDEVYCVSSNKIVVTPGEYYWDSNYERQKHDDVLDPKVEKWKDNVLTLKPWKTSPGKKTIYAFLNPPAQYVEYLKQTLSNKAQFKERVKEPIPYQGDGLLTYTDKPKLGGFRPDPNIATKVLFKGLSGNSLTPGKINIGPVEDLINKDFDFDSRVLDLANNPAKPTNSFYKYADHMMCSGIKREFEIRDNVSENQVANGRENLAMVSVRRVLAQAAVTWDKSIIGQGIKGDPKKEKMELKGIYYQVLNFEPTFYPIAEHTDGTDDNEWFNIKNTKSPSYGNTAPSGLIDFKTYKPYEETNNRFDPVTLDYERFFRNAISVNKSEVLPPSSENNKMQLLLRRKVVLGMGNVEDGDTWTFIPSYPYKTPTVHWGGCYLTETTQPWGDGEGSGYRKGNTPFFAVIASFAIKSLPWDESALTARKKREAELQKSIKEVEDKAAAAKERIKTLELEIELLEKELEKMEASLEDPTKWSKAAEYTQALEDRDKAQEEYDNAGPKKREKLKLDEKLAAAKKKVDDLRKDYYKTHGGSAEYDKHIKLESDLTAKITEKKALEKSIANLQKEIDKRKEEASKITVDGVTYDDGDDITPITYAHGINRIYYSLDTQKFYLNYHDIPVAKRGGGHNLNLDNNKWLAPLIAERDKAISNDARVKDLLPKPTEPLLKTLSDVLNDDMKAEDLSADEQRAMDFYLYGRVAPDLVPAFKPGARKYDYIDLRLGYVEDYTAKPEHKDKVVNYEIMTRYRGYDTRGNRSDRMTHTRLLMVYYAWVNPNTTNNRTWYSSPVLRNNIYHMHITGFTKMGLSGIPFVKKPDDPRFSFLHNIDPDEKVPSNDEYLPIQDPYMNVKVTNVGWGIHSYKKQF